MIDGRANLLTVMETYARSDRATHAIGAAIVAGAEKTRGTLAVSVTALYLRAILIASALAGRPLAVIGEAVAVGRVDISVALRPANAAISWYAALLFSFSFRQARNRGS